MMNKFHDCIINYNCSDKNGTLTMHRIILSKSKYFEKLFEHTEATCCKIDKSYLNSYDVKLPFTDKSLLFCTDYLYHIDDISKSCYLLNYEDVDYHDLIRAILFFGLNELIKKVVKELLKILLVKDNESIIDNQEVFNTIELICNNDIDISIKKAFIARTMYLLDDINKQIILDKYKEYIPEHIYRGKSFSDDKMIVICSDDKTLVYNDLEFKIRSRNLYQDDETEFRVVGNIKSNENGVSMKSLKYKIMGSIQLIIYDGISEKNKKFHKHYGDDKYIYEFPNKQIDDTFDTEKYNTYFPKLFNNLMAYEIIITPAILDNFVKIHIQDDVGFADNVNVVINNNVAIGMNALHNVHIGANNIAIGLNAL